MTMPEPSTRCPGRLRIAFYSGLCVRYDAISNSLRLKLDVCEQWRRSGVDVEAVAFVHCTDYDDPRIRQVDGIPELLRDLRFRSADLHIFEYGIYYSLFDALFLIPDGVPVIGMYHNVTPPALEENPAVRASLERSLVQRHNLSRADHICAHGEYSRRELLGLGFPPERLTVLPLPPALDVSRAASPTRGSGDVELLYVGRFVRAKGVLDLLDAVQDLIATGSTGFRLTMAGNPGLSSPDVYAEVQRRVRHDLAGHVRLLPSPDVVTLAAAYAQSDIFVIPSYHEGYCVPAVEALASGCRVVAYDSSNLPFVLNGLGTLVPTGDVKALASGLSEGIVRIKDARATGKAAVVPTAEGDRDEAEWRAAVVKHLEDHSEPRFRQGFIEMVVEVMARHQIGLAQAAG
jgi:glycosyltransferase involved in cell wall biosynthesis